MNEGKVLILTDKDKNANPIKDSIGYSNFKASKDLWQDNDMVIYINSKGISKVLLNRFGDIDTQDYKEQATKLAKEDVIKYFKDLNSRRGILQSYISIFSNGGYTREAKSKFNEFYAKHLEDLCL